MPDSFCPTPASARVEDAEEGVNLRISGTWPDDLDELVLNFPSVEDLGTWLDGPVVRAVQAYKAERANRPVSVIKRGLVGRYADLDYQAEMILQDLKKAGYTLVNITRVTIDSEEKRDWVHPTSNRAWPLDEWGMRDGLGDLWHWAGEFETDATGAEWPILRRDDWEHLNVRWDHVEANGRITPVVRNR